MPSNGVQAAMAPGYHRQCKIRGQSNGHNHKLGPRTRGPRNTVTHDGARVLEYPTAKGIPIDRIDTHSLQSGGANALSLSGYSDTQIQKMGRWRGATFKEYIREELARFSEGMSKEHENEIRFR